MAESAVAAKTIDTKKENPKFRMQKAEHSPSSGSPVEHILFLQRTIGNQAVHRLMKSGAFQAKFRIGATGDVYEQEADRVAEQVVRMSEPRIDLDFSIQKTNDATIQLKKIEVGDAELPDQKDLSFTIATVLGESSPEGPISEKIGIALVLKKRVENRWGGKSKFRDIITDTGVFGNPSRSVLARLAEMHLNEKADTLEKFQKLVDKADKELGMRKSDRTYLKTKAGFQNFVKRIEQVKIAIEFVLGEARFEPDLAALAKEATWWGGEMDLWDTKDSKCQIWKHGKRIMENELVFVIYKEIGKTYFLKEAKSISDEDVRIKEIERSKKFLCEEFADKTACKPEIIIKKNPECGTVIEKKKEEVLQRKGASDRIPEAAPETETLLHSMKDSVHSLSDSLHTFSEPRPGYDFGGLKKHIDVKAASEPHDSSELQTVPEINAHPYGFQIMKAEISKPAGGEISLEEVLGWTEKLSGLPYGFYADDTYKTIFDKKKGLNKAIDELEKKLNKKDISKANPQEKQELEKAGQDLKDSKKQLAALEGTLQEAKEAYWNKTLKELVTGKVGKASPEIMTAIQKYGIVCNTYVEVVMRMSGFSDFPLTDLPYIPKSKKYKKKDEEKIKQVKARSGWGLEWAERMVDWALSNGKVVYEDEDPANKILPPEPKAGDIVIFGAGSSATHVNLVVADEKGKFNFVGASSPGRPSGKSLVTPFAKYDDKLPTRKGPQDIPHVMGQQKYLWILRPGYGQPESKPSEAVSEKE